MTSSINVFRMAAMVKKVMIHWVWVGDSIPEEKLNSIAVTMKLISLKNQSVTGAIWWLNENVDSKKELNEGTWFNNDGYGWKNFEKNKIENEYEYVDCNDLRIKQSFEIKQKKDDSWSVPVFKVNLSEEIYYEINKWREMNKVPDTTGEKPSIAARIALSDIVRLKILSEHAGLYLDFDAFLSNNFDFDFDEKMGGLGITCRFTGAGNSYPENDVIWVDKNSLSCMKLLYDLIVNGKYDFQKLLENDNESKENADILIELKSVSDKLKNNRNRFEEIWSPFLMEKWNKVNSNFECLDDIKKCVDVILKHNNEKFIEQEKQKYFIGDAIQWKSFANTALIATKDNLSFAKIHAIPENAKAGDFLWKLLGFSVYQNFMLLRLEDVCESNKLIGGKKTSGKLHAILSDETKNKKYYSWKDPGAEYLFAALNRE